MFIIWFCSEFIIIFAALLLMNLIISKLVQRYMDHRSLQGLTE